MTSKVFGLMVEMEIKGAPVVGDTKIPVLFYPRPDRESGLVVAYPSKLIADRIAQAKPLESDAEPGTVTVHSLSELEALLDECVETAINWIRDTFAPHAATLLNETRGVPTTVEDETEGDDN